MNNRVNGVDVARKSSDFLTNEIYHTRELLADQAEDIALAIQEGATMRDLQRFVWDLRTWLLSDVRADPPRLTIAPNSLRGPAAPLAIESEAEPLPDALTIGDYNVNGSGAPGRLRDLVAWIMDGSYRDQPDLALANSIAFLGALFGRKIEPAGRDTRTNVYCVAIAPSGSGKDQSRKRLKMLCTKAGITAMLGGEGFKSDSAILNALTRNKSPLFMLDEVGHMLGATKASTAQTFQRAIPVTLTKLFTSSSTMYRGDEYAASADIERQDIDQPNLCLYGSTTQDQFYEAMSRSDLANGFLGRILIFRGPDRTPDLNPDARKVEPPAELVEWVGKWFQYQYKPQPMPGSNLTPYTENHPLPVPIEPQADRILKTFTDQAEHARDTLELAGNPVAVLWSRAAEYAWKLALIAAGAEASEPEQTTISANAARWAVSVVERLTAQFVNAASMNIADSPAERELNKVLTIIREAGPDGIVQRDLLLKARGIKAKDLREHAMRLVDEHKIRLGSRPSTSGPPAMLYTASEHANG